MEPDITAIRIREYLTSLETCRGPRLQDLWDDEVYEVLALVPWVRMALAQSASGLPPQDQHDILFGLRSMAA